MIFALLKVIDVVFDIFIYLLIANVILSWLYTFNIVNPRSRIISTIGNIIYQITEPILAYVRRFMPNLGTIDISPIVVFLIIYFIRQLMWRAYFGMFF